MVLCKTTLFDSIQLALFGKYIKASGKFTGGYESIYVASSIETLSQRIIRMSHYR